MFTPKSSVAGVGGTPSSASGRALASGGGRRRSYAPGAGTGLGRHTSLAPGTPYGAPGTPFGGSTTPLRGSALRSPFVTPGRGAVLPQFTTEASGSPLPALVMEALTFADKGCGGASMSVVVSACGWSWLVVGRRLLVWWTQPNTTSHGSVNSGPVFRELLLPQTDLSHRAQLVVLRHRDPSQVTSCMAVSPEGAVRYWPNIAHESQYNEITADLQGQECDSICYLGSQLGYFLATTTCTTLLLQPHPSQGTISVRSVKVPGGLLGGLSRRVTSLMFGAPLPHTAQEARLVRVLCRSNTTDSTVNVLVLSHNSLQCWQLSAGQPDKLIYQADILTLCQQALYTRIPTSSGRSCVWLLDMQALPQEPHLVTLLVSAVNTTVPAPANVILALMTVSTTTCPDTVTQVTVLQHSSVSLQPPVHSPHSAGCSTASSSTSSSTSDIPAAAGGVDSTAPPPAPLHHFRLLLSATAAFIYSRTSVLAVPVAEGASLALASPVSLSGDSAHSECCVLGAGVLPRGRGSRIPAFFTASRGLVTVTAPFSASQEEDEWEESPGNVTGVLDVSAADATAMTGDKSDSSKRLQTAFMYHNRGDSAMTQSILEEVFPASQRTSTLPAAVTKLSLSLLDDPPAADPRWAELVSGGGGGVMMGGDSGGGGASLLIANQLRDKITAHKYFISFLQQTGLWGMLGADTRVTLLEHSQRLAFAGALRSLHQHNAALVDQAIREVLEVRGEEVRGRLTPSDVFYYRCSRVDEAVWGLLTAVRQVLTADTVPRDAAATLHASARVVVQLLHATAAHGDSGAGGPTYPAHVVPWTSTEGERGVRTQLLALHAAIVETGLPRSEDPPTLSMLYSCLVELCDLVLGGYQPQLAALGQGASTAGGGSQESPSDAYQQLLQDYQSQRYKLLQPLVSGEQFSQALSLAEKYCDFRTLVEVCDKTGDSDRLDNYMGQFQHQGFADFVFRWHLETGKRGRLLRYNGDSGILARFLSGYSGLQWVQQLQSADYAAAHSTLKQLALNETDYVARKKTLLSLGKLCYLACDQSTQETDDAQGGLGALLTEEELTMYQQQLPTEVLTQHGLITGENGSADDCRVLTPQHIIELYTSPDNTSPEDFVKALDVLAFVPCSDDAQQLRSLIWVRSLVRDPWWQSNSAHSEESAVTATLFFRTAELAFTHGAAVRDLLPPADSLLGSEGLEEFSNNTEFSFLVKAAYERLEQLVA